MALVVRGVFGRDQRFALALWLPSPWWWIACVGITAATVTVALLLPDGEARQAVTASDPVPPRDAADSEDVATSDDHSAVNGTAAHDALSGLVLLVGISNGVAPLIARLLFGGNLLLALPLRLPAPWWWLTSLAVILTTVILIAAIDSAKQHHTEN